MVRHVTPTASVPVLFVLTAAALATAQAQRATVRWPSAGWSAATPESAGLDPAPLTALDRDITAGVYGHVDRLFIVRGGRAVVDKRYARDYREISRGRTSDIGCGEGCANAAMMHEFNYFHPNWHPFYQGRAVHTLQSVTKSIAATMIGIALGRKEIDRLDTPVLTFFKSRDVSRVDPRLRKATLEHVLTMRSGIEWHEWDRPLDATNTTVQLERSKDWIQFTLEQPMDADPGTKWAYNSGGSQLLSGVIKAATGRFIDEYADAHLFRPLGIRDFHWKKTPDGHPDTEGGLYLTAEDLAKIGYLYLHDGVWDGARILPDGWVKAATTRHTRSVAPNWDYGYQWWITTHRSDEVWAGRGFGGQTLLVIPSREIVAVVNAWNVFGGRPKNILPPLLDALVAAR
jgi:CubicO group peptidase (beta-lactamase class C family)